MTNLQIQTGKIIAIETSQKILVEFSPLTANGCGGSCHCGAILSLENKPRGPRVWINMEKTTKFALYQTVFIATDLPSMYTGIFLILALPVIALLGGAILANHLAITFQWQSANLATGLGAILGFILAMLIAVGFDTWYRRTHKVYRILEGQEAEQAATKINIHAIDCGTCAFALKKDQQEKIKSDS